MTPDRPGLDPQRRRAHRRGHPAGRRARRAARRAARPPGHARPCTGCPRPTARRCRASGSRRPTRLARWRVRPSCTSTAGPSPRRPGCSRRCGSRWRWPASTCWCPTCAARRATASAGSRSTTSSCGWTPSPTWRPSTSGCRRSGSTQSRSALWGGSYGGYMVLAGVAMQPERWAAGVDIVGISSLVTFLENTSGYRRAYREREYGFLDRHREFLEKASPLTYLDDMVAPLFVIHGANDPRVPLSEAAADQGRPRRQGRRLRAAGVRRRGSRPRQARQPHRRLPRRHRVPGRAPRRARWLRKAR